MTLEYSEKWGEALEHDHDAYMDSLYDDVEHKGGGVDATGYTFCGCETCVRRASWSFLMERALKGYIDGIVTLEE